MKQAKLLAHLTGRDEAYFLTPSDQTQTIHQLKEEEREWLQKSLTALEAGVPLSRVLQTREFWSLPFGLNEATLDPRGDSEALVEATLSWVHSSLSPGQVRILDLGTGSGCLILSLLSELPQAQGVGIDKSQKALEQAHKNAQALGFSERVEWVQGEWLDPVEGVFDLIISNPPYIPSRVIPTLDLIVQQYDPWLALDGGGDGLECYRAILKNILPFLRNKGAVFLEIGTPDQVQPVEALLAAAGLEVGLRKLDGAYRPRVVWGRVITKSL